jgi:hypothetical protein
MPNKLATAHRKLWTRVRDAIRLTEKKSYQRQQGFDAISHVPGEKVIIRGEFDGQVDDEAVQEGQGGGNDGRPDEYVDNS